MNTAHLRRAFLRKPLFFKSRPQLVSFPWKRYVLLRSAVVLVVLLQSTSGVAGVVSPFGSRWDAAPRTIAGNERSLAGGLRYSVTGGSYSAYRDQFSWNTVPSVAAFQQAVEQAFGAWTSVDPVSGFGTSVSFASDFATPVATGAAFGACSQFFLGHPIQLGAGQAGQGFGSHDRILLKRGLAQRALRLC